MFEYFTEPAQRAVTAAQAEAQALGHESLDSSHLLLGVLALSQDPATGVLARYGITLQQVRAQLRERPVGDTVDTEQLRFSAAAKTALERSLHEAITRHHARVIEPADVLLGLLADRAGPVNSMLIASDIDLDQLRTQLQSI